MRGMLLLLLAAAAAGVENCGGAPMVEPKVCTPSKASGPQPVCSNPSAIEAGQKIPVHVHIRNKFNYESKSGQVVHVKAKLKAGTAVQIVFTCLDAACKTAPGDVLEYTGEFHPPTGEASTGVSFTMGRVKGSGGVEGSKRVFKATDASTTGGFALCSRIPSHATACGHLTITKDLPISENGHVGLGIIYMRALKRLEQPFSVQVAGTSGLVETVGGICANAKTGAEFSRAGSGKAEVLFRGVAPPPQLQPVPRPTPTTAATGMPVKKGLMKGLTKGKKSKGVGA